MLNMSLTKVLMPFSCKVNLFRFTFQCLVSSKDAQTRFFNENRVVGVKPARIICLLLAQPAQPFRPFWAKSILLVSKDWNFFGINFRKVPQFSVLFGYFWIRDRCNCIMRSAMSFQREAGNTKFSLIKSILKRGPKWFLFHLLKFYDFANLLDVKHKWIFLIRLQLLIVFKLSFKSQFLCKFDIHVPKD